MISRRSLLIFFASTLCLPAVQASENQPLETVAVESRTVPREYRLDGLVEAINRATVSAQISGQVQDVYFDVHDQVEKGDLLLKLRDTEYRAGVTRAQAEVQSSAAELKQRKEQYDRVKGLFGKKLSSQSAMDQATADLKSAEARYAAASGALEQAEEQLRYTEIRAPYPGLATERHVEEGEMASPGQPVMSGISLDHLRVMIDVPQSIAPALRKSGRVRVTLPDERVLDIEDIKIYPIADSGSSSFRVRVNLPQGTKPLFPGMFVKVSLVVGEKQVIAVPESAVVKRSEVTGAYVLQEDGRISFRQIRVGRHLDDHLTVLSGLARGERIATDPSAAVIAINDQRLARARD
jgi:RND family efflux transporter MFP subunit